MPWHMNLLRHAAAFEIAKAGSLEAGKAEAAKMSHRSVRTIERWYAEQPEFVETVQDYMAQMARDCHAFSHAQTVSDKVERVAQLDRRWKDIIATVDMAVANLHDAMDRGDKESVKLYSSVLTNCRLECDIAKQAAIELGQWQEKTEIDFAQLSDAQLVALLQSIDRTDQGGGGEAWSAEEEEQEEV